MIKQYFNDNYFYKRTIKTLHKIKYIVSIVGKPLYLGLVIIFIALYLIVSFAKVLLPRPKKAALVLLTFSLLIFTFIASANMFRDMPSVDILATRTPPVSTKIHDRHGELLYTFYNERDRTLVSLPDIPTHVQLATLAAEDSNFYNHIGISVTGISRAAYKYITEGKITGGSTITQQLVKNALLTPDKTIKRKLVEVILALQTERRFTKEQILEMYLNEVPYGGAVYGIQAAAKYYFNKDVATLTLSEAALLAGLPKSPSVYSPFNSTSEKSILRRNEVLDLMKEKAFITKEENLQAKKELPEFSDNKIVIKAPHFVMYVKAELDKKYGADAVGKSGFTVTTTLDMQIQRLSEDATSRELERLAKLNVTNAGVIVLDAKTGAILAMVGSKDYFDFEQDGQVNVTTSLRQPGSSIKIVNYAYALSSGFTPASVIDDAPITYNVPGSKPYSPQNYDGKFLGKITLRDAFAQSRNVPAVRVLSTYGANSMAEMGRKMGITTWPDNKYYGLSLTLGGGATKLIDLARVYATVADYGNRPNIYSVSQVIDTNGKSIYQVGCLLSNSTCPKEQVLDQRVAFLLTDILRDNTARAPAFGSHSTLVIPNHPEVAVKTGTSNDLRDNLTIGYTQDFVVAVWVGNNDNSPMSRVASGITGASSIWNTIMTSLMASESKKTWEVPNGLALKRVCTKGGKEEWFLEESPLPTCTHEYAKDRPNKQDT